MRIGIDYTAAVQQRAGIGRYTRGLVRALAEVDRENEYVLFTAVGGQRWADRNWPQNFRMRMVPLSDHAMAILWHRLRLPLPVEVFIGRVDLFHSPDFVLPPTRARAILTVHDLSFLRCPECADPNLRAYLNRAVPRSVRRADLILADSQNTKDDLVELLGVSPDKIEVVYPGVDGRFRPIEDEALLEGVRRRYNLPPHFVLSLGTLEPRKNFVRLIEAFASMQVGKWASGQKADLETCKLANLQTCKPANLHLVIAGGKGWLYEGILRRPEELGISDAVLFLGFIPDEDLPALYNLADLFVYPSLYEGFGLPPLEAMACGVPVVASNRPSLPEVLGQAALLVDPLDVEGLAAAMKRALEDEGLRKRMVKRGLERARGFTWRKAARELLRIYGKAM